MNLLLAGVIVLTKLTEVCAGLASAVLVPRMLASESEV
jgi:hypothetical protein